MRKTTITALAVAGLPLAAVPVSAQSVRTSTTTTRVSPPVQSVTRAGTTYNTPQPANRGYGRMNVYAGQQHQWRGQREGHWNGGAVSWSNYHRPVRGWELPEQWRGGQYYIRDYTRWGLATPQVGYRWVRYYNDAVLIDPYGRVEDWRAGLDWGDDAYAPDYADNGYGYNGYSDNGYAANGYVPAPCTDNGYGATSCTAPPPVPAPDCACDVAPDGYGYSYSGQGYDQAYDAQSYSYGAQGYGYSQGGVMWVQTPVVTVTPGVATTTTTTTTTEEWVEQAPQRVVTYSAPGKLLRRPITGKRVLRQ